MRVIRIRGAESAALAYAAASGADKSREINARRFIDTKNVAHGGESRDAERGYRVKNPMSASWRGQVAARLGGTPIWVFRNRKAGLPAKAGVNRQKQLDRKSGGAYNYPNRVLWSGF